MYCNKRPLTDKEYDLAVLSLVYGVHVVHVGGQFVPQAADESRIAGIQSLGAQPPRVLALEEECVLPDDRHCVEGRVAKVRFVVDRDHRRRFAHVRSPGRRRRRYRSGRGRRRGLGAWTHRDGRAPAHRGRGNGGNSGRRTR